MALGDRVFAGTDDGRLLAIDADGQTKEHSLELTAVTDLSAGAGEIAALDGEHLHVVRADDLTTVSRSDDDADALSLGRTGDADMFTTTALNGRITTYAADGTRCAPSRPRCGPRAVADFEAAQRAAAVSWEGVVWASAVTGLVRWAAP